MARGNLRDWYTKCCEAKITCERFRTIVAEQLSVDIAKVIPEASFENDLNANELDALELAMSVEEEFDIEIPDEDVYRILTVKDAENYILRSLYADHYKSIVETNNALDELADSLEKNQLQESDDMQLLISEALDIDSIRERKKVRKIFNLLQELSITDRAEANDLLDRAMDHEYMAHFEKVEEIQSFLNNKTTSNLENMDMADYRQFALLAIERAKERKKKALEQSLKNLETSASRVMSEISSYKSRITGREDEYTKITEEIKKLRSNLMEFE